MGIPDHLTCLLQNLYASQEATVRTRHGIMDWFIIGKRICQGCILSPCLFNLYAEFSSVTQSHLTLCDPHRLQHTRLPSPSPILGAYSHSCPLSRWCHPSISSSVVPFSSHLQSFPASGSFSNESVLCIRWPRYWSFSFSISPSNEYSGLISFGIDWFDLLVVQGLSRVLSSNII